MVNPALQFINFRGIILDKSIPFKHIIMRLTDYNRFTPKSLPTGYRFKFYTPGDEINWAEIEYKVKEFDSFNEALRAFYERYTEMESALEKGLFFILDDNNNYCGTCMAWVDPDDKYGEVNALHWLAVSPEYQNMGLAKALISKVIELLGTTKPIYLHTQTWSYKAVLIYQSLGFRLLKSESFYHYPNEYTEAMALIKDKITPDKYNTLIDTAE